ncbi:hypothetical protein [Streptomyces bauhiniae]|uniref:hypothetical protein n=1 Tax=Streptomyces bauhiniae TaxID=2340725 RepID=UPI0037FCEC98
MADKTRWGLSIDATEQAALGDVLDDCPNISISRTLARGRPCPQRSGATEGVAADQHAPASADVLVGQAGDGGSVCTTRYPPRRLPYDFRVCVAMVPG